MERIETEILVVGGGIAGLATTALLAAQGREVLCLDAAPREAEDEGGEDLRTTAFLEPSVETLRRAGAWEAMAPEASPLWVMRIADAGGAEPAIRETADFDAREIGDRPFGWNVPNTVIRRALLAAIDAAPGARLAAPERLSRLLHRDREIIADTREGLRARARLVIGADGRDSEVRRLSGIEASRWGYGQKALVCAVSHPVPHGGVSTEIHRSGGPFTLVPLPDRNGSPCSSVVWMDGAGRIAELAACDETEFAAALNERACGVLGRLAPVTPRAAWPIVSQLARRLDAPRVALMAEAAHVVPPIGAQGLNMSLGDAATLAELLGTGPADPGAEALLARYHRARWPEMAARVAGVDALNRASQAGAPVLRDLRRAALRALHAATPLRRAAMRAGVGGQGGLG